MTVVRADGTLMVHVDSQCVSSLGAGYPYLFPSGLTSIGCPLLLLAHAQGVRLGSPFLPLQQNVGVPVDTRAQNRCFVSMT